MFSQPYLRFSVRLLIISEMIDVMEFCILPRESFIELSALYHRAQKDNCSGKRKHGCGIWCRCMILGISDPARKEFPFVDTRPTHMIIYQHTMTLYRKKAKVSFRKAPLVVPSEMEYPYFWGTSFTSERARWHCLDLLITGKSASSLKSRRWIAFNVKNVW